MPGMPMSPADCRKRKKKATAMPADGEMPTGEDSYPEDEDDEAKPPGKAVVLTKLAKRRRGSS